MIKQKYMIFPLLIILLAIWIGLLGSCAVIKPPSGGPKDTIPPEIVGIYPLQSQINFKEKHVDLLFSKYMNKGKVASNIFIQPELRFEASWWGRRLRINFVQELDTNTTYAVSLGTDYTDHRGNKPRTAFSLIFSTGTKIDSGRIVGKLFGENPDGFFIYAYNLDKVSSDTLDFTSLKPDYKIQCGTSGEFTLKALKPAKYRIIAINDKFGDGLYSAGIDEFSSANQDFPVNDENLNIPFASILGGVIIDKSPPALQSAYAKNARSIIATFSESLDSLSIIPSNFTIKDSLASKEIQVKFAHFESQEKRNKLELITQQALDGSLTWMVKAGLNLADSSGNKIAEDLSFAYFKASAAKNKALGGLTKLPFKDSARNIDPMLRISFEFNLALLNSPTFTLFTLDSIPKEIEPETSNISNKSYFLSPALEYEKGYRLRIDLTNVESYFGEDKALLKSPSRDTTLLRDTIIKLDFFTKKPSVYSKISGVLADSTNSNSAFILQLINSKKIMSHSVYLEKQGAWSLDSVVAGSYQIRVFLDENRNGHYDKGNDMPFEFSERFYFIEKTLEVKERWDQEDLIIVLEDENEK